MTHFTLCQHIDFYFWQIPMKKMAFLTDVFSVLNFYDEILHIFMEIITDRFLKFEIADDNISIFFVNATDIFRKIQKTAAAANSMPVLN